MAIKAATFIVLAVFFVVACARPYEGSPDCTGKLDGLYDDPTDNRGYYVCIGEQIIAELRCRQGSIFDNHLKQCVSENPADEDQERKSTFMSTVKILEGEKDVKAIVSDLLKSEDGDKPSRPENGDKSSKPEDGDHFPDFPIFDSNDSNFNKVVRNVVITENIFPESVVIIGASNRENSNNK